MRSRSMISSFLLVGLAGAIFSTLLATPSDAKRRSRGKSCMTDHFHYGASSGQATKKKAHRAAVSSWADFTAFEYGSAWASFRLARSKRVSCHQDAAGWACNAEGVPCRRR